MTIKYLDSKRLEGVAGDLTTKGVTSGTGGWKELGRTTLNGTGDTILVSGLANKRYFMVLADGLPSGNIGANIILNSDTSASSYSQTASGNGATDTPLVDQTYYKLDTIAGNGFEVFGVGYIANLANKEKLMQFNTLKHDGNGTNVQVKRIESVGKWDNTSDAVSSVSLFNHAGGDYASGSEVVVLGFDPLDTHTDNFWEELSSTTVSSNTSSFTTETFAVKKYLWIQIYNTSKASGVNQILRFNGSTGNEYNCRTNTNGANPTNQSSSSDYEANDYSGILLNHDPSASGLATGMFSNVFMINVSDREKMIMVNGVSGWTYQGAGVVPARFANVGKWEITGDPAGLVSSVQITGVVASGSVVKVWGHD